LSRSAVELRTGLRLCEIRRGLPQNLIRSTELEILSFQFSQALAVIGREARAVPRATLCLLHPTPERLMRAPDLLRDGSDRCPLRPILRTVVLHQPHRPLAHLCREPRLSCPFRHDSILSREGASDNPGAIQADKGFIEL